MGNCFTVQTKPKRDQLSGSHLLNQQSVKQPNLTDSEQNEIHYQEMHQEPSITNNNHVIPPQFPLSKNGTLINSIINNDNDAKYDELQQQIEILKQCSNAEIKMMKSRIQMLETKLFQKTTQSNSRQEIQLKPCTKGTATKQCPNIIRIVTISKLYNNIIQQNPLKKRNEFEIWNSINAKNMYNDNNQYDIDSLLNDYCHFLEFHCNNNNLFELKMVYLELHDIVGQCCSIQCKAIDDINIYNNNDKLTTTPNLIFLLDVMHCYFYHAYTEDNDTTQKLRDCIMNKNDLIFKYFKNPSIHVHTPPIPQLFSNRSAEIIIKHIEPNLINVPLPKSRHNSVNSVVSNMSAQSQSRSSKSSSSHSKISSQSKISSLSNPDENDTVNTTTEPSDHNEDRMKINLNPHTIEMSEDRVRKLSGHINKEELHELIQQYDDENKDELILYSSSASTDDDIDDSSLDEDDKKEIEQFKLKIELKNIDNDKQRKGSRSNLVNMQQANDWDVDEMNQTAQEMKKQLFHLALTSPNENTKILNE